MTEGSIGFWLQNALENALVDANIEKSVASVVTQVIVDKDDPAFADPSKPIGPFYSEEEAKAESEKTSTTFKEDAVSDREGRCRRYTWCPGPRARGTIALTLRSSVFQEALG